MQGKHQQLELHVAAVQKALVSATETLTRKQEDFEAEQSRARGFEARLREAEAACQSASSALAEERAKHEAAQQELQERVWEAQEQVCSHHWGCFAIK